MKALLYLLVISFQVYFCIQSQIAMSKVFEKLSEVLAKSKKEVLVLNFNKASNQWNFMVKNSLVPMKIVNMNNKLKYEFVDRSEMGYKNYENRRHMELSQSSIILCDTVKRFELINLT